MALLPEIQAILQKLETKHCIKFTPDGVISTSTGRKATKETMIAVEAFLDANGTSSAQICGILRAERGGDAEACVMDRKDMRILYGKLKHVQANDEDLRLFEGIRFPYVDTEDGISTISREPGIVVEVEGVDARRVSTQHGCGGLSPEASKRYRQRFDEYREKANRAVKELAESHPGQEIHEAIGEWLLENVPGSMIGDKMAIYCDGFQKTGYHPVEIVGWRNPLKEIDSLDIIDECDGLKIYNLQPLSNDPGEIAIRHVLLESLPDGDTPTWDEMAMKYTADEWKVLCAYIYSIFYMKHRSRQSIYIYDNGHSGKSCMFRVIMAQLGEGLVASPDTSNDLSKDKFFNSQFYGKRLIVVPDNKNPKLVCYEWFHKATGGDSQRIEFKNKDSFSAKIYCKMLVGSNTVPEYQALAQHIKDRIIILRPKLEGEALKKLAKLDANGEMVKDECGKVILKEDPQFEQGLNAEFKPFLKKCGECYRELCPKDGDFDLPASIRTAVSFGQSMTSEIIEEELQENADLQLDPEGEIPAGLLAEKLKNLGDTITEKLHGLYASSKDRVGVQELLQHLAENHSVTKGDGKKRVCGHANPCAYYRGIRLRDVGEMAFQAQSLWDSCGLDLSKVDFSDL